MVQHARHVVEDVAQLLPLHQLGDDVKVEGKALELVQIHLGAARPAVRLVGRLRGVEAAVALGIEHEDFLQEDNDRTVSGQND